MRNERIRLWERFDQVNRTGTISGTIGHCCWHGWRNWCKRRWEFYLNKKIWFSLFLYLSLCVMQASYQVDALCRDRCRLRGNCSWRKMFHQLFVASCMLFFHLEPLTNVFFCQLQKQYCTLIFKSHATKLLRQYHQVVQSDVPIELTTLKISSHFPEWCSDRKITE